MSWPDVVEQLDYWASYPPAHLLLRSIGRWIGLEFRASGSAEAPTERSHIITPDEEKQLDKLQQFILARR